MSQATLQLLIDNFVRDDNGKLSPNDRDEALKLALEQYSQDRPLSAVEDVATGAGGTTLALPAAWEADFSSIDLLEYPVSQNPPALIHSDRWTMYQTPSGYNVRLIDGLPAAVNVRVSFSKRHTVSAALDTIPVKDREPFCKAAAAILCDQLAAIYANNSDATIQADTVDHKSQSADYRAMANKYRKDYLNFLGVDDKRPQPAGIVVALRPTNSLGNSRLLRGAGRSLT